MNIKLALVQANLVWENVEDNLKNFDKTLKNIELDTDIVILPEVFSTAFTMNSDFFTREIGVSSFEWMQKKAQELNKVIVGSILLEENEKFYNRMYWMQPDGNYEFYDKRHLFQMGGEHKVMTAGDKRVVVNYKGIKFMLQVCYDLRFPVFVRNHYDKATQTHDYDVLLYIANWPEVRAHAYNTLLKARAIENQAFAVWVNRVGEDGHQVVFSGDSQVISPYGIVLDKLKSHKEAVLYTDINMDELVKFRSQYRVGLDWD